MLSASSAFDNVTALRPRQVATIATPTPGERGAAPVCDKSGRAIFADGDLGQAHVMVHRFVDENRVREGYETMRSWLRHRPGAGAKWVHLQFHMALFELELGKWHDAFRRFKEHVLPAAEKAADAVTDAPALLWRLLISAPHPIDLPWEAVRQQALSQLGSTTDPFVEAHNLLALGGARDADALESWAQANNAIENKEALRPLGLALHTYARGDYAQAANRFQSLLPALSRVGGSGAQNKLFGAVAQYIQILSNKDGRYTLPLAA